MDKLEICFRQREEVQDLIQKTDAKASSLLLVVGFLTSAFAALLFNVNYGWQRYLFAALYGVALFCALFVCIAKVLLPRMKNIGVAGKYIGANYTKDELKAELDAASEDAVVSMLLEDILLLNNVLIQKNKYMKIAFIMLLLLIAIIIFGIVCATVKM